ncbi:hypothetical protein HU200_058344 [Digitaria exilis]|uniref:F-box domain-containing protein n=1 Tax=Digitaria exilis TaxID=1010633 RepID=A0A835ADK2_9POAL|nr:hypothetical protein HU200_058344 [Digitaria exilis]
MLFEILLRLPTIKDLSHLRLVCRAWRDLLTSDPTFARAHPSSCRLVAAGVCKLRGEIKFVDVLSGEVAKRMPVQEARVRYGHNVTTQAGYVCVQGQGSVGPCVVAAVATGAATILPAGVAVKHSAGDRIVSSTSLLGRVPSTGDYKVLRTHLCFGVVGPTSFYYHTCDVTTLGGARGDGRWRVRPDPPMCISGDFERRVVVNGVAYFLSDPYNCSTTDGSSRAIASFDMATEEWRSPMLRGPLSSMQSSSGNEMIEVGNVNGRDFMLAEVNCFLVTVHLKYQHLTDLWFLVDVDKGLWTKRYSVETTTVESRRFDKPLPLVILDDGRIVFWKQQQNALRVYDPEARRWDDVATVKDYFCIGMFKGSLLCSGIQG